MAYERLAGRNGEIWRAWVGGETQAAIAERHGITQGRVSQIVSDIRDSMEPEDRALLRLRELDASDRVRAFALGLMDQAGAEPLERLNAARVALAASERVSKLLGLDAALKQDVTVTGSEETAAREAAAAAAAHLHGGAPSGE